MISVVIPTLDEERYIAETISSVKKAADIEVIVADGGSSDRTPEIAEQYADKLVISEKGRGAQMNAGAANAEGESLLFLHGDTVLPENWDELVKDVLKKSADTLGAFRLAVKEKTIALNIMIFSANIRARIFSLPYGDQALFLSRTLFDSIDGFKEIPLMEDIEMVRMVKKIGKIKILNEPVVTSSRRWKKEGCFYSIARNQIFLFLYLIGIPAERLSRLYKVIR